MSRVFVTGVGVVAPTAIGRSEFHAALCAGRSGVAEVTHFDTAGMDRTHACEVKGFRSRDHLTAAEDRRSGRCSAMAIAAARMAVEDAGMESSLLCTDRCSVILGTTMGEANLLGELEKVWIHEGEEAVAPTRLPRYGTTLLPIHVARALGARGMVLTLPAACAAGNYAIGFASDQIREGRADVVITGGSEVIERLQYAGFLRLGAMAPDHCRPFDANRRGLIIGEGAGILVLESEAHLVRRGGRPLAEVGGYGLACDAHHITRPHPEGEGSERAMLGAIASSGLTASEVDFINAHGTGTQTNDPIESRVLARLFGEGAVPVSSIKSMIGHCMGAASAIEAVSCVLTLDHDLMPPTIHHEHTDPACPVDVVANRPRSQRVNVVLNNSLAFGGYDAVVTFARVGTLPNVEERGH
ncbi:MAG: beta-ketoacyl-[acyl-carrier-protein] synthase family protein [Myxococcota bacterium]